MPPSMVSGDSQVVFFDLETTGLDTNVCDIIQISAISGDSVFDVYTFPCSPIPYNVTQITGLSLGNSGLLHHGNQVPTVLIGTGLASFISFLRSFQRPLLIAAHNGSRFDVPVLERALQVHGLMCYFQQMKPRFLDTLLLGKQLFPTGISSYSQENLVQHFLGTSYDAHNALADVKALQELYRKWDPDRENVSLCSF